MYKISIDIYTLVGILAIAFILLIAMVLIFVAYMCHDKRKYSSIDKYNELTLRKSKSYNDNLKEYNESIDKSGVNHEKNDKLKFLKTIISLFKRNSK